MKYRQDTLAQEGLQSLNQNHKCNLGFDMSNVASFLVHITKLTIKC